MKLLRLLLRNTAAWAFIQLALSYTMMHVPRTLFPSHRWLFQSFTFEDEGRFWQRHFKVKKWKHQLPDSSSLFSASFNHRELASNDLHALQTFSTETNRAEFTHWLTLLICPFFYFWNPRWAARVNVFYALISSLPFIIVQRYNRPKLQRLITRKKRRLYDNT